MCKNWGYERLYKKTCGMNPSRIARTAQHILVDEEKHVDWIEAQLHQIHEIGNQNYLAQRIKKD
jgi:bacterioferritin